jgi:hypothetical protein
MFVGDRVSRRLISELNNVNKRRFTRFARTYIR